MTMSTLQTALLTILPASDEKAIPAAKIFERLGIERPSASQRVSLSRSLARLAARRQAEAWHAQCRLQGNGYLWCKARAGVANKVPEEDLINRGVSQWFGE
jgi:hypothetical protein